MKCLACDKILSDYEATRKYASNGDYIELCNGCFYDSDLPHLNVVDRPDLAADEFLDEHEFIDDEDIEDVEP